jgi:hypothetical protein
MFGTLAAGLNFSGDMIQAAMGHDARESAEAYIHHSQHMADEVQLKVLEKVSRFLSLYDAKTGSTKVIKGRAGSASRTGSQNTKSATTGPVGTKKARKYG